MLGTMISLSANQACIMAGISKFGLAKLRALVPPDLRGKIDREISGAAVPEGDRGISGERDDQLERGDFRSRYEHLARYRFVSEKAHGVALDLGCGTGYGSSILSQQSEILGIDSSQVALDYAKKSFPRIDYVRGSAEAVPISDESLDAVIAFEVIEHLGKPEKMLDECRRTLRKGGMLYVSTPNPAHLGNIWQSRLLGKPMPSKVDVTNPYHIREFSYMEMRELLKSRGFRLVNAIGQTVPLDWCVPGLGFLHKKALFKAGPADFYEWLISILGRRVPSMSWTVVYSAVRE